MKYHFTHGIAPQYIEPKTKRDRRLKSSQCHLAWGILFKNKYDGVFLRCLEKDDAKKVLSELHNDPVGGNFEGDTITHKIPRVGYYFPTLFIDAHTYENK
jgi:hypothetical protein